MKNGVSFTQIPQVHRRRQKTPNIEKKSEIAPLSDAVSGLFEEERKDFFLIFGPLLKQKAMQFYSQLKESKTEASSEGTATEERLQLGPNGCTTGKNALEVVS